MRVRLGFLLRLGVAGGVWGLCLATGHFAGHGRFNDGSPLLALLVGELLAVGAGLALLRLAARLHGEGNAPHYERRIPWLLLVAVVLAAAPFAFGEDTLYRAGKLAAYAGLTAAFALPVLFVGRVWFGRFPFVAFGLLLALVIVYQEPLLGWWLLDSAYSELSLSAWALTWLLVACLCLFMVAATNRLLVGMLLGCGVYCGLCLASAVKLSVLHSRGSALDVPFIPEAARVYLDAANAVQRSTLLSAAGVAVAVLVWGIRRTPAALAARPRLFAITSSPLLLALLLALPATSWGTQVLASQGIHSHSWGLRGSIMQNGFLVDGLLDLRGLATPAPKGYGGAELQRIARQYGPPPSTPRRGAEPVDVIVYLIESFWDPTVLPLGLTADPLPNFRRLLHEHGENRTLSPVFGGMSSNSEFELLAGVSVLDLPVPDTVAYGLYVRRELPALPAELRACGYETYSIDAEPLWFQSKAQALPRLGIDHPVSLHEEKDARPDAAGRTVADEALVERLFEITDAGGAPKFVHLFPNSTHMPWDYEAYRGSELTPTASMPAADRATVHTYVNALRTADKALARLIDHYAASARKTVVLVTGDHLPVWVGQTELGRAYLNEPGLSPAEAATRRYGLKTLLWKNFGDPVEPFETTNNLLGVQLLRAAGVSPSSYWHVLDGLAQSHPQLGHVVETENTAARARAEASRGGAAGLQDAALLQYDMLFGERYLSRLASDDVPHTPLTQASSSR